MAEPREPRPPAVVTVIVVTWQGAHLLDECLDSLAAQSTPCEVLVVDNASTDATAALLARREPAIRVLTLLTNTGFAGGVEAGLACVDTPFVALLNNDASASSDWLARSLDTLRSSPDTAAVTAKLLLWDDDDGRPLINNAGVSLTASGYGIDRGGGEFDAPPYDRPAEVFGFSGGAAVLRADAVRSVGGMPARFFLYYEDVDLSWRLRLAGWTIRYEPTASVRHRHAATTDRNSASFAFYNERNRLLTLTRCAPLGLAAWQLARFIGTTASLQARRARGQQIPDVAVFDLRLRLHALRGYLWLLPWALSQRRRITRGVGADRAAVARSWVHGTRQLS